MIFVLTSDAFKSTFDDNTSSIFKSRLLQRTSFPPSAHVALQHLRVPSLEVGALAFVYCSCADVVQVGARSGRLLQIVYLEASKTPHSYAIAAPLCRKLACSTLEEVRISILGADGKPIAFKADESTTLLLRIQ